MLEPGTLHCTAHLLAEVLVHLRMQRLHIPAAWRVTGVSTLTKSSFTEAWHCRLPCPAQPCRVRDMLQHAHDTQH